jgi:hypothetical protein
VLANAVNERKRILRRLFPRKVDTCDTCHKFLVLGVGYWVFGLTLALLMLGVDADHSHDSFALDDLALVANLLNTGPYFHSKTVRSLQTRRQARTGDARRDYTYLGRLVLRLAEPNRLILPSSAIRQNESFAIQTLLGDRPAGAKAPRNSD